MIVTPYNRTHKVSRKVQHCISELESLAITPNRLNELNDAYEMENLVEGIRLILYQDYKLDQVFL
jgi:hypothetical protein